MTADTLLTPHRPPSRPPRAVDRLPSEVRFRIASFLSVQDACRLSQVARRWQEAGHSVAWREINLQHGPEALNQLNLILQRLENQELIEAVTFPTIARSCPSFGREEGRTSCYIKAKAIRDLIAANPQLASHCRTVCARVCPASSAVFLELLNLVKDTVTTLNIDDHDAGPRWAVLAHDISTSIRSVFQASSLSALHTLNITITPFALRDLGLIFKASPNVRNCKIEVKDDSEWPEVVTATMKMPTVGLASLTWTSSFRHLHHLPQALWHGTDEATIIVRLESDIGSPQITDIIVVAQHTSSIRKLTFEGHYKTRQLLLNAQMPHLEHLSVKTPGWTAADLSETIDLRHLVVQHPTEPLKFSDKRPGPYFGSIPDKLSQLTSDRSCLQTMVVLEPRHQIALFRTYQDPGVPDRQLHHYRIANEVWTTLPHRLESVDVQDPQQRVWLRLQRWSNLASYCHKPVCRSDLIRVYEICGDRPDWLDPGRNLNLPEEAWAVLAAGYQSQVAGQECKVQWETEASNPGGW